MQVSFLVETLPLQHFASIQMAVCFVAGQMHHSHPAPHSAHSVAVAANGQDVPVKCEDHLYSVFIFFKKKT